MTIIDKFRRNLKEKMMKDFLKEEALCFHIVLQNKESLGLQKQLSKQKRTVEINYLKKQKQT